jgi:hypothetical protein
MTAFIFFISVKKDQYPCNDVGQAFAFISVFEKYS